MLWTIAFLVAVASIVGLVSGHSMGDAIGILVFLAVVIVLVRAIHARRLTSI